MLYEAWWGSAYDIDPATGEITRHRDLPFPMALRDYARLAEADALRERLEWWRVSEFLP